MRVTLAWLRLDARRRWRSLTALGLLIALSAGTVLGAIAAARRGDTAVGRLLARTLPATVTVLPNQPGFDWDRIRALPEVTALTTFAVAGYGIKGLPAANSSEGFPPGDDAVMRTIERPVMLQGRMFDPRRADEVVVTPQFPVSFGKSVGDYLTLQLPTPKQADEGYDPTTGTRARGPQIRVRITGVVRSPWFSDTIGNQGAVVPSPALFAQHRASFVGAHDSGFLNALIRLRNGRADLPRFRADLARVTHRNDIDIWDNLGTFGVAAQQVDSFEAACMLAFGLAALAAAIFLLGQSIARYISATVAELQLLRAVGMTPRQAVVAAAAGPFLTAIAGTALGVAAAIVVSQWMPIGAAALVEPGPGISADWLVLGVGGAVIPLLVLAGSAAVAAAAVAAGRAARPARRSSVALALTRAGAPVPLVIGSRFALEAGRGRSAVPVRPALAGAIVGVLGVLAAFTFTAGVTDAAHHPERFGQTAQLLLYVGMNGQTPPRVPEALAAVARDPGVAGLNDARIAVAYSGNVPLTTYSIAPVGGKQIPVVLTAGRLPAGAGEIVLAPISAQDLHANVGSVIPVSGGPGTRRYTVTGIGFVPNGPHNGYADGAWVTPAGYQQIFTGARYAYKFRIAEVTVRPGADVAAVGRRISKVASQTARQTAAFQVAPPPDEVRQIRDVSVLPVALSGFLALLAAGAVGHALATAVRRRRHELGVLRALGLTRPQSWLVVITQASLLALIGLVFGVPLGLALGRRLWHQVAETTPLAYHPPLAVWALLLIVPAGLLAANLLAVWPGHRAAGLRSGQVLRTE
ncbi:MAG TPA: FtsX-like permease family protein [Streptosporangiaceae bacterium]